MVEAIGLLVAFLVGAVSFASPCIIPMVMVYLTAITGFSWKELLSGKGNGMRRKLFLRTLAFALSFTLVFTIVGGLAGTLGAFLAGYFGAMAFVSGIVFIIFGAAMLKLINLDFISQRLSGLMRAKGGLLSGLKGTDGTISYAGVFMVGLLFALVCVHCISPTIFPAVVFAASTGSTLEGMLVMLAFSLGLALPFVALSLFLAPLFGVLRKHKGDIGKLNVLAGIVMVLFGLLLASGRYLEFVGLLQKIVPWKLGFGL